MSCQIGWHLWEKLLNSQEGRATALKGNVLSKDTTRFMELLNSINIRSIGEKGEAAAELAEGSKSVDPHPLQSYNIGQMEQKHSKEKKRRWHAESPLPMVPGSQPLPGLMDRCT